MNKDLAEKRPRRVLKWVVGTATALLVMFVVLVVFGIIPFQFVGLLLFGWIAYLARVLPEITFNPEIAFDGVVALVLALFGLHRILCWWLRQSGDKSGKWRFSWTLKVTVMLLLLFATSIASVGMIHQIGWLCHEQKLTEMAGMSKEVIELSNIKQVAIAIRSFADDHEGQFPRELVDLFPRYLSTHKLLFTRSMDDDPPRPIIYYTGYSNRDDAGTIIVASPRLWEEPRGRSRVVAYLDGSARIILDSEFQEAVQRQQMSVRGR